jgi:hypothetical protein
MIRHAKKRAEKYKVPFDLDQHVEKIKTRLARMRCEMTGIPLQRGSEGVADRKFNSPSLDRIVPSKGYVYKNIRIVCWAMNCAMGTWGEGVLRTIVKAWIEK